MTAPGQSTFDGNPNATPAVSTGYRPGLSDFNGGALKDDPQYPPDPSTMPTSALFNTIAAMLVSMGKMVPTAFIGINAGASPTVAWWGTAANLIGANPFTVTRNSAGNYSITWTAGVLPNALGAPNAQINAVLGAHNYSIGTVNIANGVQVTTTEDGVLTDLNFTVWMF